MDGKLIDGIIAIAVAIVGVATAAVIFSKGGQTANVIKAGGDAFSSIIKAAVGPVT